MPTVPSGIIIAWPSTVATIPTGWTRETNLDSHFIVGATAGADADLVTSNGSNSHTHTSPTHTPTQQAHTHLIQDLGNDGSNLAAGTGGTQASFADYTHLHSNFSSNSSTPTNTGVAITVDATNNDLAHRKVIWIKSNGAPTGLPANSYAFFESDTLPANWNRVANDLYLKGAGSTADGGSDAGSNTHTHTSPAHTHSQGSHTHSAKASGVGSPLLSRRLVTGTDMSRGTHTHAVSGASATGTNQSVTTTIDPTNHEPPYKKINCISNSISADLPDKIIAVWGGANSTIPTNWSRYTSLDGLFVKNANANGESNITTGGTSTHTHTASTCQPVQNVHSHSWAGALGTTTGSSLNTGANISSSGHTHTWADDGTTVPLNNSTSVSINSNTANSAYPKYKTAIFVQYTAPLVASITATRMLMGMGM